MRIEICELCLLARLDPDLRERHRLDRLNIGDEIILCDAWDCTAADHDLAETAMQYIRRLG